MMKMRFLLVHMVWLIHWLDYKMLKTKMALESYSISDKTLACFKAIHYVENECYYIR